jgi:hypothetical protein
VNIIELGFLILTVGGGIIGGEKGYPIHGGLGASVGVVVGASVGAALACATTFLLAALMSAVTKSSPSVRRGKLAKTRATGAVT